MRTTGRQARGTQPNAARGRRPLFRGAYALVTGGSRGLGFALARELMQEGAHVTLLARDESRLARAKETLERQFAREVRTEACDLERPAAFERSIARVAERSGRIDLLINNAGIIRRCAADQVPMSDWERAMSVHFWSPLHGMRAVIPMMRKQRGGRIINISSIEGRVSFPLIAPYCASKFALTGLSKSIGAELARERIWVTIVYPGLLRREPSAAHAAVPIGTQLSDLFAMPLDRAARRVVRASHARTRSVELGATTKILIRAESLFPKAVGALMEYADAALRRFQS